MTVDETVRRGLWYYATIFKSRADVLHHLFYVLGNGYEWKGGELVSLFDEGYDEQAEQSAPKSCYPELQAEWDAERDYNRTNIDRLTVTTGELNRKPYVPCDGAHIHHIPDDVKPDWLDAAIEIEAIVKPLHDADIHIGYDLPKR